MKSTYTRTDNPNFEKMRAQLKKGVYARVGILGDGNYRLDEGDAGNADIGLIQEFGSVENNIPPRSFLRMPLTTKRKDFMKYLASGAAKKLIEQGKILQLFQRLGLIGEIIVDDAFVSSGFGQWAPNSPVTVALKGSSKPLIDTSQLRRAITSDVVTKKDSK